jgi:calcineurin-like phosphoesterase family protein
MLVRHAFQRLVLSTVILALAAGGCRTDPRSAAWWATSPLLSGPYVIDVTSTAATVCWQTREESAGEVRVGTVDGSAVQTIARQQPSRFHAERLTGLVAGVVYRAEVRGDSQMLADVTFAAAPEKADAFTFFAYGDTRTHSDDHAVVAAAIEAEAERRRQFTFLLHTGDFARSGSDTEETAEQFFRPAARLLARMPLVPVHGNHEIWGELYQDYFPPQSATRQGAAANDRCIDYGSVRLVVIDRHVRSDKLAAKMQWLAARLAEAQDRWRIVSFHTPIYSSGKHRSATRLRAAIEPVLVAGKVHLVIAGHDHNYERTQPIKGITHFTTGGGGAPLREESSRGLGPWSALFASRHHFLTIAVTPEKLAVQAHGRIGETGRFEVFDSVEIPRACDWPQPDPGAAASPQAE